MSVLDEAREVIDESNFKLAGVLTSFFNGKSNKVIVPDFYYEAAAASTMPASNQSSAGSRALFEITIDTIKDHYSDIYVSKLGDIKTLFKDIVIAQEPRFGAVAQVGHYKKENDLPARDPVRHELVIENFVNTVELLQGGDGVLAEKLMRNMADYCADMQEIYKTKGSGVITEALLETHRL